MNSNPAREAIQELALVVEWLAANLLPGTGKPWSAPVMTSEKRAERDLANREREAIEWSLESPMSRSVLIPLGESPAPMDLNVLDLLVRILCVADELADTVSDAAEVARLTSASSAFADPGPFLSRAAAFITACDPFEQKRIEQLCDDLTYEACSALGLVGDGQQLAVICPWCNGRTEHALLGGQRTMRVRVKLPAGQRSMVAKDPAKQMELLKNLEWLVVCEGLSCKPPSKDCGNEFRGRPAWLLKNEADHLAAALERASVMARKVEGVVAGLAS